MKGAYTMQHTKVYAVEDGTTYRVQYDNETADGEQMHYLVYENDVLKLEVNHHRLPEGLTEAQFQSVVVIGSFWDCLGRSIQEYQQQAELVEAGGAYARLANMIRPHMTLRPEQIEWARTLIDRGHDVELLTSVLEDAQVERFARELNAEVVEGTTVTPIEGGLELSTTITGGEIVPLGKPSRLPSWVAPTLWAANVVLVVAAAIFVSKLLGWE